MADNQIGLIRRSMVVMASAPGSIMDMRADGGPISAVHAGLEYWDKGAPLRLNLKYQKIIERRLCKKLSKRYFRLPPVLEEDAKIPGTDEPDPSALLARRFPDWLQCPECHFLRPSKKWTSDPGRAYRYCSSCSHKQPAGKKVFVVPVRFITTCLSGHLDEFPWNFWVQHDEECQNRDRLKLESKGAGIAGLVVSCPDCKRSRSLGGAFNAKALSGLHCQGRRPWLSTNDQNCRCNGAEGSYRVVQRGASNLYYPVLDSALDIPPWTRNLERMLGDHWDTLADIEDFDERVRYIPTSSALKAIIARMNISAEALARTFEKMRSQLEDANVDDFRKDEYHIFTSGTDENDPEFENIRESVPPSFASYFTSVSRVARLREVRVLRGFTRITPPFDPDGADMAPISEAELEWLPAIEVRGEGIFLQFNPEKIASWEKMDSVQIRCAVAKKSWERDWKSKHADIDAPFPASPRLLLIHTVSHCLIRQLAIECGYSMSSLRERLYVAEDPDGMCGLLIYTATPDSDGTLGGLARQAGAELLDQTLFDAINTAQWCSSDPLCLEGELAVPESHSLASCHSCTMLPETSCEQYNRFMDRALLIGTESEPEIGFFSELIKGL